MEMRNCLDLGVHTSQIASNIELFLFVAIFFKCESCFLPFSVYHFVCAYTHLCKYALPVWTHVEVRGQLWVPLSDLFAFFLRQDLSLNLELPVLARPAASKALRSACPLLYCWGDRCVTTSGFYRGVGNLNIGLHASTEKKGHLVLDANVASLLLVLM